MFIANEVSDHYLKLQGLHPGFVFSANAVLSDYLRLWRLCSRCIFLNELILGIMGAGLILLRVSLLPDHYVSFAIFFLGDKSPSYLSQDILYKLVEKMGKTFKKISFEKQRSLGSEN